MSKSSSDLRVRYTGERPPMSTRLSRPTDVTVPLVSVIPQCDIAEYRLSVSERVVGRQDESAVQRQPTSAGATGDDAADADPERHSQTCSQTSHCALVNASRRLVSPNCQLKYMLELMMI